MPELDLQRQAEFPTSGQGAGQEEVRTTAEGGRGRGKG